MHESFSQKCTKKLFFYLTGRLGSDAVGMAAALEDDKEHRFTAREESKQAQRTEQRKYVYFVYASVCNVYTSSLPLSTLSLQVLQLQDESTLPPAHTYA